MREFGRFLSGHTLRSGPWTVTHKAIKGRLVPPPTRQAVRCSSQGVSMQPFSGEQAGECTVLQGPASQCSNMALEEHS